MMKLIRTIHTAYGFIVFSILFLIFFFLFLFPIAFPSQFKWVGIFNRWWARVLFPLCLLPYKVECRASLSRKSQYIFCPNHFSYLDIPVMGLNPVNTVFVGKNDMEHIPLFGFMYRKLHITVNRSSLKSRMNTIIRSMQAIDEGKSLVIFPEGGVLTENPPQMIQFKDGAFRISIEKQIPIVPVTIPFNWIILSDRTPLRLHAGRVYVIFHAPVSPAGYTLDTIEEYKKEVYMVIDTELKRYATR
ncbi:MAG: 1-acyl-sn-glycerol-3-phosphate acyltransferase [Cyclobacteriaceae bacterium]|nr:1-acyl-sn-glycerol-3-phosphate acyltransferase [Cyclobacteriaceae bacterium]